MIHDECIMYALVWMDPKCIIHSKWMWIEKSVLLLLYLSWADHLCALTTAHVQCFAMQSTPSWILRQCNVTDIISWQCHHDRVMQLNWQIDFKCCINCLFRDGSPSDILCRARVMTNLQCCEQSFENLCWIFYLTVTLVRHTRDIVTPTNGRFESPPPTYSAVLHQTSCASNVSPTSNQGTSIRAEMSSTV